MHPMEKGSRSENKKTIVRLSVHIGDKGSKGNRLVVTVQSYAKVSSILSVVSDPRSLGLMPLASWNVQEWLITIWVH